MPISQSATRVCAMSLAMSLVVGCSNNPFKKPAAATPVSLVPPAGVAAPAATLPQAAASSAPAMPSFADVDGRQLQTTLARSREETQLLQDEITVLREQLASTSNQLAATRSPGTGLPGSPPAPLQPGGPAASFVAGMPPPALSGPAALQAGLSQLALPGIESRFDGNVVRLELPADRLFDRGSASLLPGGAALLTQVAGEVDRLFPRHFVGIEGHIDTEPVEKTSWDSPHQLTAARAATVFDFFTSRTPLREGQLFLVAHGSNHPVVSNATAAGRNRNRRVELVIYQERMGSGDDPPADQARLD